NDVAHRARRRRVRRRGAIVAVAASVVAAVAIPVVVASRPEKSTVSVGPPPATQVAIGATRVAWVDGNLVRTLDGATGKRASFRGTPPLRWSSDGEWLAYLRPNGDLWAVHADGTHGVRV